MTDFAIRVEGLSKEYVLGAHEKGYKTFREAVIDSIAVSIGSPVAALMPPAADARIGIAPPTVARMVIREAR